MKEEKQIVNKYDYGYDKDSVTTINSQVILNMMFFLEQIIEREPNVGILLQYPEKTEKITDEDGNLLQVKINWQDHNANSFFFTGVEEDGAVPMLTDIAFKSQQLLYGLTKMHEDNINRGIAKLITDKDAEEAFK